MNRQLFGRTFRVAKNCFHEWHEQQWIWSRLGERSQEPGTPEKTGLAPAESKESLRQATVKGACAGFVWASWIKTELRRHGIPAQDSSRPLCIRRCVAQNVGLELFHVFRSPVR